MAVGHSNLWKDHSDTNKGANFRKSLHQKPILREHLPPYERHGRAIAAYGCYTTLHNVHVVEELMQLSLGSDKEIIANSHWTEDLTYIIDHYNPSVRITVKLLTPLMLNALILYINGGTYSFKVDSERHIFEKLFIAILFTFTVFLPEICREEVAEEIGISS